MDNLAEMLEAHPILAFIGVGMATSWYITLLANERYWKTLEALLGLSYILALPFSGQLLRTWLDGKEGDYPAKVLFILILLGMVCQSCQFYSTTDSTDLVVMTSLLITCFFSRVGLLFAAVNAILYTDEFSKVALMGDCVFLSLLIIGNLTHLKKLSTNDGRLHFDTDIRKFAVLDGVACFVAGLSLVGFPDTVTEIFINGVQVSNVHTMLMKSLGFLVVSSAVLSLSSLSYKYDEDVRKIFLPKLWILIPITVWNAWLISGTTANWPVMYILVFMVVMHMWIAFRPCSEKTEKCD